MTRFYQMGAVTKNEHINCFEPEQNNTRKAVSTHSLTVTISVELSSLCFDPEINIKVENCQH